MSAETLSYTPFGSYVRCALGHVLLARWRHHPPWWQTSFWGPHKRARQLLPSTHACRAYDAATATWSAQADPSVAWGCVLAARRPAPAKRPRSRPGSRPPCRRAPCRARRPWRRSTCWRGWASRGARWSHSRAPPASWRRGRACARSLGGSPAAERTQEQKAVRVRSLYTAAVIGHNIYYLSTILLFIYF